VQAFLEETLDAADPQRQRSSGRQTTIVEALDRARVRLETAFVERPEIEAAVQHLVGKLYSNLGSYEDAEPLLRQALATRRLLRDEVDAERDDGTDADVAATLESLAALLGRTGRAAEAEPLLEEALMMRRRLGGGGSSLDVAKDLDLLAHVASARGDYAQAAELEREALELYRWALGERAPSVVHALATIAGFERADGDLAAAESALRRAVHILDGLPEAPLATRAELDMDLGELLEAQGRYEAAERKIRKGLEIYRRVYGDEHHWVAQGHVRLGTVLTRQRRWDEAEEHLRRGVAIVESVLEPDHPDIAISLNNFAFMLAERGDLAPASSTFERVLAMQRRTVPDHPVVGVTLRSLGLLELRRGRPAESRGLLEEALSIHRRHHGENHPRTARSRLALGRALGELGDGRRAVELQREALAVLESTNEGASADSAGAEGQRPDHPQVAEARAALARSLVAMGRRDEAEDLLRRALPVLEEVHGPDDHRVREARETLAAVRGERRQ
jgi:tetratricopeptide (TPR) repeat protein